MFFTDINVHKIYQPDLWSHHHNFYELVYVVEGSAVQELEEEVVTVKAGNYFLVDYGSNHSYSNCENFYIINCLFDPQYIDKSLIGCTNFSQLITNYLIHFDYSILSKVPANNVFFDSDGSIKKIFLSILTEYERKNAGYIELIRCLLIEILIRTLRLLYAPVNTSLHPATKKMEKYIEENYSNKICNLEDISKKLGYSTQYLSKKFKEDFGKTFTEVLQEKRIVHSCRLLVETKWTIPKIAEAVGYCDIKYFGIVFKNVTKMTPREFRKKTNLRNNE